MCCEVIFILNLYLDIWGWSLDVTIIQKSWVPLFKLYFWICVCVYSSDRVQRQEREVMLKLKGVVDKQRDDLRAKVQEIATISKEVEAVSRKKYI